jgi:hypothetical protein
MRKFIIEDEIHAEPCGDSHDSIESAIAELHRLSTLPWDQPPNQAPCTRWRTCGREYVLIEYEDSSEPWSELRRLPALNISASEVSWVLEHGI